MFVIRDLHGHPENVEKPNDIFSLGDHISADSIEVVKQTLKCLKMIFLNRTALYIPGN